MSRPTTTAARFAHYYQLEGADEPTHTLITSDRTHPEATEAAQIFAVDPTAIAWVSTEAQTKADTTESTAIECTHCGRTLWTDQTVDSIAATCGRCAEERDANG